VRRTWRIALVAALVAGVGGVATARALTGATVGVRPQRSERPPRSLSVVAVGDWLPEYAVLAAASEAAAAGVRYDHAALLAPVAGTIAAADLAICHAETPIGRPGAAVGRVGRAANGRTLMVAPFELAADLRRVGFDRCSTASNHAYDLGTGGIASTLEALDDAGLGHAGTARSPAEAVPVPFDVRGVRVAHLSFARNTNTAWPAPWALSRADDAATVRAAVDGAKRAGAEVVIVSLHVFVEMASAPTADDRALVEALTRPGDVDLVVVHGPHVVQPLEVVHGTPVFWSLGNLASGMGVPGRGRYSDLRSLDGLIAAVRFTEGPDGSFTAEAAPVLTCQDVGSRVVHQGLSVLADPSSPPTLRGMAAACHARSWPVVADLR
jgi:poly-gamma-glutamate synthesis protein (capsule biosynthesis protein)